MQRFFPIPTRLLQKGHPTTVRLYIKHNSRLVHFLSPGTTWTAEQEGRLERDGISKLYVRSRERTHLWHYTSEHLDTILADPAIPSEHKGEIFYHSAAFTMQRVFDDPRAQNIATMKRTVKSLIQSIRRNQVIMQDLFLITAHDYYTYTHSVNVGIFATALALRYYGEENPDQDFEKLSYGFFLHDIGKSLIPPEILNKPSELTEEEWRIVKRHPQDGYSLLMRTGNLTDEAAYITLQHHEQLNGSGYPYGREAREIHPCARICSIADTFDALTSVRPYKPALSAFQALRIMQQERYGDFDYDMLESFIRLLAPVR